MCTRVFIMHNMMCTSIQKCIFVNGNHKTTVTVCSAAAEPDLLFEFRGGDLLLQSLHLASQQLQLSLLLSQLLGGGGGGLRPFVIHCGDDLYHTCIFEWEASFRTHNSSLEGDMKLKFAPNCSS